jgi:macrodomain Ter protein organizer (MatP/YcbG family)
MTMTEEMSTHKKVTITLHPIEIEKVKKIAKECGETFSGMIARLIHDFKE